jgi:dCMP deaminase
MMKRSAVDTNSKHSNATDVGSKNKIGTSEMLGATRSTAENSSTIYEVGNSGLYGVKTPGSKRCKKTHVHLATDEQDNIESNERTENTACTSHTWNVHQRVLPSAVTPASDPTIKERVSSADVNTVIVSSTSSLPMQCSNAIASMLLDEAGYCSHDSTNVKKRANYISWDDYFMAVATLSSYRSKDPHLPTGACIVDSFNRVIGTGYNGFPAGCSDDVLPWANNSMKSGSFEATTPWLHTKTPFMVHAEVNAILNKCSNDCNGARLYTQHFPCNECAKVIIQSRIVEIIYVHETRCGSDTDSPSVISKTDDDSLRASRILLTMANVRMRQYKPKCQQLHLNFYDALDVKECKIVREKLEVEKERECTTNVECSVTHRDLLWNEAKFDILSRVLMKRQDYLTWDDYFMSMAFLTAQRSKDPNTQVGACIVDSNKRIVGLGYNGFPSGCSDDNLPWSREAKSELHKKYVYVCHAEVNAILNKGSADLRGGTLYVALFPCNECSKVIIQAGIREVVYMSDRYHDTDSCRASRILLQMAGVHLRNYIPPFASLTIDIGKVIDL